jgi:hypothetical protein
MKPPFHLFDFEIKVCSTTAVNSCRVVVVHLILWLLLPQLSSPDATLGLKLD